jgi:glycosyltransferase involved in cell wall biosynthesis
VHVTRLRELLRSRGREVCVIATGRQRGGGGGDVDVGNSLRDHMKALRSVRPGIVHVHHSLSLLTALDVAVARRRGLPVALSVHGAPVRLFTRRRGVDWFLRFALGRANHVIVVNRDLADLVPDHVPKSVIPAFLPPTKDDAIIRDRQVAEWVARSPTRPLLSAGAYRVLSPVNGGSDVYGFGALLALMERLARSNEPFRMAVLLSQPPRSAHEERFLEDHIRKAKGLVGDDFQVFVGTYAPPVVAQSAVFLRPTLTDGDSVAVREALAFGVPVVASDVVPRPAGVSTYPAHDLDEFTDLAREYLRKERAPEPHLQPGALLELEAVYEAVAHGRR